MTPQELIYATNVLISEQIQMQSKLQTLTHSIYLLGAVLFVIVLILYVLNKKEKKWKKLN